MYFWTAKLYRVVWTVTKSRDGIAAVRTVNGAGSSSAVSLNGVILEATGRTRFEIIRTFRCSFFRWSVTRSSDKWSEDLYADRDFHGRVRWNSNWKGIDFSGGKKILIYFRGISICQFSCDRRYKKIEDLWKISILLIVLLENLMRNCFIGLYCDCDIF